jgi:hypothetical protein
MPIASETISKDPAQKKIQNTTGRPPGKSEKNFKKKESGEDYKTENENYKTEKPETELRTKTETQEIPKTEENEQMSNLRKLENPTKLNGNPRLCIRDPKQRERIVKEMHDDPAMGGHAGIDATTQKIKDRFHWENIRQDVEAHVRKCNCYLNKHTGTRKQPYVQPIEVHRAFEDWTMDFIGPLPLTKQKNQYILNMQDRATKYTELVPTPSKTMAEVVRAFRERVLLRWGVPKYVKADNAFKGEFADLCESYGIKVEYGLPHQHNSQGMIERNNRTMEEYLRNYVNVDKNNWDELLPEAQFARNNRINAATKMSAQYAATGREPVLKIERLMQFESDEKSPEVTEDLKQQIVEIKKQIEERTKRIDEIMKENTEKSQSAMLERDKNLKNPEKHAINSWVGVLKPVRDTKLDSVKTGPYKVIEQSKERPANYRLSFMGLKGNDVWVHADKITTWKYLTDKQVEEMKCQKFEIPKTVTPALRRQLDEVVEKFKLQNENEIDIQKMMNQRIEVNWATPDIKGFEKGTIRSHMGQGKFWIEYDYLKDEEGTPFFKENLLTSRPPKWRFL